jgi:hypothetical protein
VKKYSLTEEHRKQLAPWRDKWIANTLRTGAYTDEQKEECREAIRGLYRVSDLAVPEFEVFCDGPISGAVAAGVAAGIWYVRDNPTKAAEMFSRNYSEAELLLGAMNTVESMISTGLKKLSGDDENDPTVERKCIESTLRAVRSASGLNEQKESEPFNTSALVKFFSECAAQSLRMRDGGNHWSGRPAYLSFFRCIVKLDIDYSKWVFYEKAAEFGPRFTHPKFWIVSALFEDIHRDDLNRPHRQTGPSNSWPDGFKLWYWHGVRVPRVWIEDPSSVPVKLALTWPNIEQRRCLAEIVEWVNVLKDLNHRVIDQDPDPMIGTLIEVDLPDSPRERFLLVTCGTGRNYALPVSSEAKTAREANASTYKLSAEELNPEVRT